MRFKDFEIRPTTYLDRRIRPGNFDVVKWAKHETPMEVLNLDTGKKELSDTYCFTVAHITWNPKEPCWEFKSVGTRFLEYYTEGLCEYILKVIEVLDICREGEDDT